MKTNFFSALVSCLLWCGGSLSAQQYFRLLENSTQPYEQKIARFANGDVLLGGSPISGQSANQSGGLNLTRLDKCGNVSWALNYQWEDKYMALKDIVVDEIGDIYVYGSAYERLTEYFFLLKLTGKGVVQTFKVFHPGTVDHFTYNIQVHNNRVMIYGLLLDYNTAKRGFVFIFNETLNYLWGKIFEPFESGGQAIITNDNGFLCHSGFYLVKLNAQGNLEWAKTSNENDGSGWYTVAGPVAVEGGYLFESSSGTQAYFYKLDQQGRLLWKSDQFATTNNAADFVPLPNGNILALYNCPGTDENFPCQLLLSPDGNVLHQRQLTIEQSLQNASLHLTVGKNAVATVIGSTDIRAAYLGGPAGFMLQFSPDSLLGNCFDWMPIAGTLENNINLTFSALTPTFFEPSIRSIEASVKRSTRTFSLAEGCDLLSEKVIQIDTLLVCGQNWQVRLPNATFRWEDETTANPRVLERPGIYRASDNNCIARTIYEYHLQRDPCQCKVYVPTAFSPNYDGQNEKLELFSSCNLNKVQFSVYDRWGGKIFSSNNPNITWDGTANGKPAAPGIYVVVVQYELLNENNDPEEGRLIQNVQLIR